ncbi:hypothetical protein cypCar_00017142, partial [Cyprinus carpio]
DKVIPSSVAHCGECRFCKSPKTNLCERSWVNYHVDLMSYPTTRFTCRGQPILQFTSTGTFSEYIVINQIYVVKIDDDAPLDRVCLLGCGVTTGYGAAVNTAGRAALESCIKGWGVSVLVGYTDVDFSARPIQLISGKTWKGTLVGGYKIKDSLPKLVNDYMTGKIMLDEFITHRMDLEQINDAINLMKTGQCCSILFATAAMSWRCCDKVIPVSVAHCGECRFCKSPKTNLCERSWINDHVDLMSYPTTCFTCRGQPILQFTSTGTFSEYIVINQIYVVKIHDDAPLDLCAVFGLGAVGLAAVMGCKNAGASRIFAVDINEQKFEKAKLFGATDFLNPKAYDKPISEVLAELTNGGVDFSIECVGNPEVMRAALESCIKGWGVSVLVGYTDVDFSARPIQLISGKTWKGTLLGGYKIKDSLPKLVNDYMTGKIMVDEFITHKMDLEQINDAINLMKTGQCIRCILNISK